MTELVFILDRSGSMSGLETDTIGGFNGMLEKQKKAEGDGRVHGTAHLFRFSGSDMLCDDDIGADGAAVDERDDKVDHGERAPDRAERCGAVRRIPAGYDHVRRIEQQLQDAREHQRPREPQHIPLHRSAGHVHGFAGMPSAALQF